MAIGKKENLDDIIGRKAKECGRCKKVMAITVLCPLRKGRENRYVCWHCCNYVCRYRKEEEMPWGKRMYCSVKRNAAIARQKSLEKKPSSRKNEHLVWENQNLLD